MIFALLLFLSFSSDFGSNVLKLTSKNFASEIDNRGNSTVYFVMFHGQHCPACRMAYPEFKTAAQEAAGLIKFGEVDTNSEGQLARRFQIMSIPTFIIFHPKGQTVYMKERSARSILNAASHYIPHLAKPVDEDWIQKDKAVILFSDKPTSPPLWAGISCAFEGSDIEIGFSNNETLSRKFDVVAFPTILMIEKDVKMAYGGKNKFSMIKQAINDFFEGKLRPTPTPEPTPPPKLIYDMEGQDELEKECKGKGLFCVIEGGDGPSEAFEAVAKKYRHDHFKFYTCGAKCPLHFAKQGVWILHHRRDAAIKLSGSDEIGSSLDRVIDGGAKFTPMSQLAQAQDL